MKEISWMINSDSLLDNDFNRLKLHIRWQQLDGSKLLLTGATGFFGIWIVELLDWIRRKHCINFTVFLITRDTTRLFERYPVYKRRPWLNVIQADIRRLNFENQSFDYIIHGATDTSSSAAKNPSELFNTIYDGTSNILNLALLTNCKRVLIISSGAVYGELMYPIFVNEEYSIPISLDVKDYSYREGKKLSELLGYKLSQTSNIDVLIARCFAFVGAGLPLDDHFAMGNFVRNAIEGEDISLNSTGKSWRSYLYAADLAIWLFQILFCGKSGSIYNVGSDEGLEIEELAQKVRDTLSPKIKISIQPHASQYVNFYVPSIEKARKELSLGVWTDLGSSITRYADDAKIFGPFRS